MCVEDEWLDDKGNLWRTCWQCGGNGYIEGECTCMDDTCCCLEPDEPACDICRGHGAFIIQKAPIMASQQGGMHEKG